MTTKFSKDEIKHAREYLQKILKPGQKIYGDVVHVSRSGMYRVIRLKAVVGDEIEDVSWAASKLLEGFDENHHGCRASGCGMDMVFHLIYNLGYAVFPDGYQCIGEKCQHNDHVNHPIDHPKDGNDYHQSTGYVFKQG